MINNKLVKKYGINWIKPVGKIESVKAFDIMKFLNVAMIKKSCLNGRLERLKQIQIKKKEVLNQ